MHTYVRTYVHTYMRTYMQTYIQTKKHPRTNLHTNTQTCMQTYIHTYMRSYTHIYKHTYMTDMYTVAGPGGHLAEGGTLTGQPAIFCTLDLSLVQHMRGGRGKGRPPLPLGVRPRMPSDDRDRPRVGRPPGRPLAWVDQPVSSRELPPHVHLS